MSRTNVAERPCILFDFDGTLADTLPAIVETARTVLLNFGLAEEDLGDMSRLVGPPFPYAFKLVYGLSDEDAIEVTNRYREIYGKQGLDAWPAFPGIPELLSELKAAGKALAVASSKRTNVLRQGISDNGLDDLFGLVLGRSGDSAPETKADTIRTVASELGFSLDDVVMVGDRHYDVEAATEAGVPCVGVYFGHTAPAGELEAAGAVAIAHTISDLRSILLG